MLCPNFVIQGKDAVSDRPSLTPFIHHVPFNMAFATTYKYKQLNVPNEPSKRKVSTGLHHRFLRFLLLISLLHKVHYLFSSSPANARILSTSGSGVEAATLINMFFKNDGKQPQEDKIAPPAPGMQHTDFVYPSGFRLALLMVSIFVGMFLVALVR